MRISLTSFVLLCLSILLFVPSATGQENETEIGEEWDWVETVDPFDPDYGDFLDLDTGLIEQIAWEAYQDQDYENAAKYYLAMLQYNVTDGGNIYNLACCYGLLGEAELAALYVERAFSAGFQDLEHIGRDPDFDRVRDSEPFVEVMQILHARVDEEKFGLGDLIFTDAEALFECRVQVPENFDPDDNCTLVVGLHGLGGDPDGFMTLWERFADHNFIYATPRAPYPFSVGNRVGYSWFKWDENDDSLWSNSAKLTEAYVAGVVKDLEGRYNVDKVVLLGFSQGCALTYMAGIHNHELFDGLICFGGWLDTDWLDEETLETASDLRVFIAHGNEDQICEFEGGIKAWDILESYGYDVTFHEFDGGHRVPEEALQEAEIWMNEF